MSAARAQTGPYFGEFGGRFMPESLIAAIDELGRGVRVGEARPGVPAPSSPTSAAATPAARRSSPRCRGSPSTPAAPAIILKREDLNHTGSHKINNVLGQALLTKRIGKTRVIAETGAGQHGVATATAAALFGLECTIYMGEVDTERQALNVARMRLLGAEVDPGHDRLAHAEGRDQRGAPRLGRRTSRPPTTSSAPSPGPHPFPAMVRDFQKIIGEEARAQVLELTGALPDAVVACVGGGSNAIGIFHAFLDDADVAALRLRGGRRRHRHRRGTRRPSRAGARACCTAHAATCCRTRTARPSSRTRSRPASTTRASAPSTRGWRRHRARRVHAGDRRRGDGGAAAADPHRGHHPGDRVGARPRRRARARPRARARGDDPA